MFLTGNSCIDCLLSVHTVAESQYELKLTYSKVEFKNVPGRTPGRTPTYKGGGEGRVVEERGGQDRGGEGGRDMRVSIQVSMSPQYPPRECILLNGSAPEGKTCLPPWPNEFMLNRTCAIKATVLFLYCDQSANVINKRKAWFPAARNVGNSCNVRRPIGLNA